MAEKKSIREIIEEVKKNPRNDVLARAILILFQLLSGRSKAKEVVKATSGDLEGIKKSISELKETLSKHIDDSSSAYEELAKHVKQLERRVSKLEKDIDRLYRILAGEA